MAASFASSALLHPARAMPALRRVPGPPKLTPSKRSPISCSARSVKLAFGGRHKDRYGRYLAQVFLEEAVGDEWVQGELLAGGHARVYGLPESFVCSRELFAHEAEARRNHLGLWSNDVYGTKPANRPAALMTLRGKYQRVIGSVASIGHTKSATYLNFGTDYRSDFTARIGKNVLAANPDLARTLDGLTAKTVIVRGWIDRRNGPLIDVADPSADRGDQTRRTNPPPSASVARPEKRNRHVPLPMPHPIPGAPKICARLRRKVRNRALSICSARAWLCALMRRPLRPPRFRPVGGLWRSSTGCQ